MGLPRFPFVTIHDDPLTDGICAEGEWLQRCAALQRPSAHLWRGTEGLVVPRRYTALPGWAAAVAVLPPGRVQVRASGGGLVPQGEGVWNLSLMWPVPAAAPSGTDALYAALCDAFAAAFARLGIVAGARPVDGSFCDGRFNLAVGGRKLVGTAQAWKRVAGVPVVLVHAVFVVTADPDALTARANDFEARLGTPTRYRADALTSVAREAPGVDVESRTLQLIAERFAQLVRPGEYSDRF